MQTAGPPPVSDSVVVGGWGGSNFCISDKFQVMLILLIWGPQFEDYSTDK